MQTRGLRKIVLFEPENTYDAFQLGRLYEKTQESLTPGFSSESDKGRKIGLLNIKFNVAALVEYILAVSEP